MPYYPTLDESSQEEVLTRVFLGYNHNLKIGEGSNNVKPYSNLEFYDMKNMTSAFYPLLANRKKRGTVLTLTSPQGMLEKDALAYVDNGTLYYNFQATALTGLTTGEKQLVSMGSYICVFPDKKYYNTANSSDYGSMEAHRTYTGSVEYVMCKSDGTPYTSVVKQADEPSSTNYELWIKTYSGSSETDVYYYSQSEKVWVQLNTVYTRMNFGSYGVIPALFEEMDAVEISGSSFTDINGSKVLYAVGGNNSETESERVQDYIVVIYPMSDQSDTHQSETITIDRNVPTMDYICEAQNRLWGCRYGYDSTLGETLNEIYCCALGDFKNWSQYLGISTDSWTGSVGTDGQWTGCINFYGTPLFFKENYMHQISISSTGAHQVTATPCRGVQKGSYKSLQLVNETLYYKSRTGVCAYQGSFPSEVSEALGDIKYYEAVAGGFGERYYISMRDGSNNWNLFVLDTSLGVWHREDATHAICFAKCDDELYCIDSSNKLIGLNGTTGTLESSVEWSATTGLMGYNTPEQKYVSRLNLRMQLPAGSNADMYIQYDSSGEWEHCGHMTGCGTRTFMLPVKPRRCDHFAFRIEGSGDIRVYSFSKILEVGSDG